MARQFLLIISAIIFSFRIDAQQWQPDAGMIYPYAAKVTLSSGQNPQNITDNNPHTYWQSGNISLMPEQGHSDHHQHEHSHAKTVVEMEQDILQSNNLIAERNRGFFEARNIFALNLVSSPGSGKTSFLEKTLGDLKTEIPFYVIEGDQQTFQDAQRIEALRTPVIQINTGQGCHLDSDMIHKALVKLHPEEDSVVMIENVGNLVCPALFDLGENSRVVLISVTEGDDKPIKYPDMFQSADICVINKIDLLPYVNFNVEKAKEYASRVNHHLRFFEVSATTGEGMNSWYEWLKRRRSDGER